MTQLPWQRHAAAAEY